MKSGIETPLLLANNFLSNISGPNVCYPNQLAGQANYTQMKENTWSRLSESCARATGCESRNLARVFSCIHICSSLAHRPSPWTRGTSATSRRRRTRGTSCRSPPSAPPRSTRSARSRPSRRRRRWRGITRRRCPES